MGAGSTAKRRRTGTDSSANSITPSRVKSNAGRGRGRPPNVPRDGRERPPPLAECFHKRCNDVLDRLSKKDHYNIFLEPVNTDDVAGYADTIKRPMDFTTMRTKLSRQEYKSLGEFRKDLDLIWSNCLLFNGKEPTNIFSKKAIELRRLTEKLIVTTRQYLEKDKEALLRWKEKHRRRRETMQANAANARSGLPGSSAGLSSSLVHNGTNPPPTAASRGAMDESANDYPEPEHNGRTPEDNALAESMRLQYSGTTGLYKKGTMHAPLPQYTKPDGSIVQIPIRPYNPNEDHWELDSPSGIVGVRFAQGPTLVSDSLAARRRPNPCHPRPNRDAILVHEYMDSMFDYVKDAGSIAHEIVSELLSPELEVKKQQEELLKQGLSLREMQEKAKASALRARQAAATQVRHKWDTDSICKLADDIERSNRRVVSMLPKLPRSIDELDGIAGLAKILDSRLIKEIDDVPVQVVDYAMPHGASLGTIAEIFRLQNVSSLQISPHDFQCLDSLRKTAQDYLSRIGPESAAKMTGASVFSPEQLHGVQMRARLMRQQRRREAQRQAGIIEEKRRITGRHAESSDAPSRKGTEQFAPNSETSRIAEVRSTALPQYRVMQQQHHRTGDNTSRSSVQGTEARAAAYGMNPATGMQHNNAIRTVQTPHGTQTHSVGGAMAQASKDTTCKNCGTRETLDWGSGNPGPGGMERLCIPCGLYWQKTHRHRPKELWNQTSQRNTRIPPTAIGPNGMLGHHNVMAPNPTIPLGTPNGIAKRPVQKMTKVIQPVARRSSPPGVLPANYLNPAMTTGGAPFAQVSNPAQAGTRMASNYAAARLQPGVARAQSVIQRFPNHDSSNDARNLLNGQNPPSSTPAKPGNSAAMYPSLPRMYPGLSNSAALPHQQLAGVSSEAGNTNLVTLQKQQLLQQNAMLHNAMQQNAMPQNAMQQSAMQQSAMQQSAIQQSAMQQSAMQQSAIQQSAMQQSAMQQSAIQQNAMQQNAMQQNAMQQNAIQQSAIQQNATQQNTIQQNMGVSQAVVSHSTPFMSSGLGKTPQMLPSTNGDSTQNVGANAISNVVPQGVSQALPLKDSVQKSPEDSHAEKEQRENQEGLVEPTGVGTGLGSNAFGGLGDQNTSNAVVGFGDDLAREGFGNGQSLGNTGMGSDEIVEDIFFDDPAIEASAGSPGFEF